MGKRDQARRSTSVCLAIAIAALASSARSADRIDLNGIWEFRLEEGKSLEETALPDFKASDRMTVPGCWDATSRYCNKRGTGCYRRSFYVPYDAEDAYVVVDGMGLRARIFVDGRDLGLCRLPWVRFDLKAGPLKAGRHEIVAAVDSVVDNSKVKLFWNFYDFYPYGGFYHGVSLELKRTAGEPRRVVARTKDYKTGLVELELRYDGDVPRVVQADVAFDAGRPTAVEFHDGRAELVVPSFRLWSPDGPNMHSVSVSAGGATLFARFGIRQVGTAGGRVTLNGRPVYLKGVNRHEQHWEFGVSTPQALMYEDIANLKDMGGNFVRGAHYPQCEAFLDLCDEMGVLVWEESIGWGNSKAHFEDPEFCDLQEEQTRLMVRNSINHPSVVISGFLNEPASDLECCRSLVNRLVDVIRAEESGHLVTFACNRNSTDICNDKTDIIAYNTYPFWYSYRPKTGTHEEMVRNVHDCHAGVVRYFRTKYADDRPIIVSETGVKADYGARDRRGRAQYTEDFQEEYTRVTLETVASLPDLAGIAIWQYVDAKTYTRIEGLRDRAYGVNTGGIYDRYRRPKLVVETVGEFFRGKMAE